MKRVIMAQPGTESAVLASPGGQQQVGLWRVHDPDILLRELEREPPFALILDGGAASSREGDWLQEVDAVLRQHPVPVIWLGDCHSHPELVELLQRPYVQHLLPREESHKRTLANLLRVMAQGRGLEPASFLSSETPLHQRALTHSGQKQEHLEHLWEVMAQAGVHKRIARAVELVADEFMVNAVYNAPVDAQGEPLFRRWPRTRPVELPSQGHASLRYGLDEQTMVVSVRDPYGSLDQGVLRQNLLRALQAGEEQIDQKEGGAGLGLFYILTSTSRVVVEVKPGEYTAFTGIFQRQGGYRRFAGAARGFHLFFL